MHIRAMRQRGRQWFGEQLEPRRVLAVMGQIYHDANGNGQRDTDEVAVYDRSVTLLHRTAGTLVAEQVAWGQDTDLNQDGAIDPLTETGVYTFPDVTPGSYEVLFTDFSYEVTAPNDVDQSYRIEVTDAPVTDLDFGVRPVTSNFEPEAGDSNVDGYFDEADLIMAYKSGKYETGQPAGFGEGNWNLDDEFNSGDLVAGFKRGYAPGGSNAQNELQAPTTSGQADVVLTYDGSTGQLAFSSEYPLSSIHVRSKSASMSTEADMFVFVPPFDIHDTSNRFLLKTAGITSVDYGNILPPGLTSQQLADDLLVDGSRQVGGDLGVVRVDCTNCLP
ncbi:MAG: hypothetical protein KDB23_32355, partial [Planctomycetales bacterium]|nr:hypothetical protein [Planctomycetales bacterium]